MFTTIKLVSRHQNTQQYSDILLIELMNEATKNSESYKEYYAIASGVEPPKTKASVRKKQSNSDTTMPPPTTKGKRLKTLAKVDKPAKEKQPAKTSRAIGLIVLSEVALTKAKQMKLATKQSLTQTHISHASGSGADERTGIIPGVPDFDKLPSKEAILTFLKELGHSGEIKMIIDVEHKDAKKSNEMYYPRFTKVIVNFFMTKDQSIPRRNKVNWHFAKDDHMFTTIKLISRHQNTQQYGAILPIELTNEAIRNSESYKEYYAIASGAEPPKTKASVRKKQSNSDTIMPPPTAKGKRLKTSAKVDKPAKEKYPAKTYKAKGLTMLSEVALTEAEQMKLATKRSLTQTHISHASGSVQTPSHDEKTDDEDNDKNSHGMNVEGDEMDNEGANEEDDANELYRDVNINLKGQQQSSFVSSRFVSNMLKPSLDTGIDFIFNINTESTPRVDLSITTTTELPLFSTTTLPPPPTPIILTLQQTPVPSSANVPSSSFQTDSKMKLKQKMKTFSTNMKKILLKIENTVNEQLEAEVLTRLSKSSKTSHAIAANISEFELKKILIEKIESNKSIHISDEQKNLYKALVDAYKWSKRRRAGKETESTSAPKEKTSKTTGKSSEGSKSHHKSASKSAPIEEPMHTTKDLEEPAHQEFDTGATDNQPFEEASQHPNCNLARKDDSHTSFNELMDTLLDFSSFVMNRLKVDTLIPELLAGPTYELMKGSCKSLVELEFLLEEVYKATTDQLDWKNPEADYGHIKWIEDLVPHIMWSQVPVSYAKHALWKSRIGGANVNNSMDLRSTGNLLEMSTPNVESSLSQSFKSSNGITTRI
nr:hypothetical protein [Tanacetum cinerariifolium]